MPRHETEGTMARTKGTKRDTQRNACYEWEREIFGGGKNYILLDARVGEGDAHLTEAKAIIAAVCTRYGIDEPSLELMRAHPNGAAYYNWQWHSVKLPPRVHGRLFSTILHEAAHAVMERRMDREYADHGPEFAALVLDLFAATYEGFDRTAMRRLGAALKPRRVRFAKKSLVPQPVSRKRLVKAKVNWDAIAKKLEVSV